jgi:hypothetical protein
VERRLISLVSLAAAAAAVIVAVWATPAAVAVADGDAGALASEARRSTCRQPGLTSRYVRRVNGALRSRRDVWGNALLAAPGGPTYDRARRFLTPLLLARAARGKPLTESGVHYAHFTQPLGAWGATSVALHVADGSQIVSERATGPSLTIGVGRRGLERYGSCLRRLTAPVLMAGYLPIMDTRYVDDAGVRYRQQSFAARVPQTRSLVSFVRLRVDAGGSASRRIRVRFTPSVSGLHVERGRLLRRGRTHLFFSPGGSYNGSSVKYAIRRGTVRTVYVAWLIRPRSSRPLTLDAERYAEARQSVRDYWESRLAEGARIYVPEKRVLDAQRNLLIQNLGLTWRYSIGNPYEQFSSEGIDVARVMARYGRPLVSRAILHTSVKRRPARYRNPNWKMGARLIGFAEQARISGDASQVLRKTPVLRRYVRALGRQINGSPGGLLRRERYSSDVQDYVYGLHSQALVWQGLRSIGHVWAKTGKRALAVKCRKLAARLRTGLRRAVRASQRRLPDGTLFIPVRLLDRERPYKSLTRTRDGTYWNLVMPYALASGLFAPDSPQARGVLAYMLRHGSRLLGMVRAGAYSLYGTPKHPASGSNPVYGLNVARFLADNDQPGQLVLSLYGQLAGGMAPGTFVSGEGVSIAPLSGRHHRAMFLPPNGASNAAFLETLRLMLVHETTDRKGVPRGLQLAYSTPRAWLTPGRRIEVRGMPTSFGKVSFRIQASEGSAHVEVQVPDREPLRALRLRLRLPRGKRITAVFLNGQRFRRFDPDTETLELPPRARRMELRVEYRER